MATDVAQFFLSLTLQLWGIARLEIIPHTTLIQFRTTLPEQKFVENISSLLVEVSINSSYDTSS
jgi:hypothetical protein